MWPIFTKSLHLSLGLKGNVVSGYLSMCALWECVCVCVWAGGGGGGGGYVWAVRLQLPLCSSVKLACFCTARWRSILVYSTIHSSATEDVLLFYFFFFFFFVFPPLHPHLPPPTSHPLVFGKNYWDKTGK